VKIEINCTALRLVDTCYLQHLQVVYMNTDLRIFTAQNTVRIFIFDLITGCNLKQ
jgi:hypothetical protein